MSEHYLAVYVTCSPNAGNGGAAGFVSHDSTAIHLNADFFKTDVLCASATSGGYENEVSVDLFDLAVLFVFNCAAVALAVYGSNLRAEDELNTALSVVLLKDG